MFKCLFYKITKYLNNTGIQVVSSLRLDGASNDLIRISEIRPCTSIINENALNICLIANFKIRARQAMLVLVVSTCCTFSEKF